MDLPAIWTDPMTCICLCCAFPHLGSCESNAAWVKMFLVRKYWQTGSFKACQTALRKEFGERRAPSKCCIQKLVKKLETRGSRLFFFRAYWRAKCTKIHPAQSNNSKMLGCERRPVSASFMSRSSFASFPVCAYKFSSHYLNNIIFIDNSLGPLAKDSPCIKINPREINIDVLIK